LSHFGCRISLFMLMLVLRGVCSVPANPLSTGVCYEQNSNYLSGTQPAGRPDFPGDPVDGLLYFSGQVAQDLASGRGGHCARETKRVFQNLSAVLKAAGKSFDDVVRAGAFLTNMSDFAAMNSIYAKHFSQPFPARTTIAAAALPLGACVEIDLVVTG
jgi:2-iminobutanoate/2-iminopropanoate deaminase